MEGLGRLVVLEIQCELEFVKRGFIGDVKITNNYILAVALKVPHCFQGLWSLGRENGCDFPSQAKKHFTRHFLRHAGQVSKSD